MNFCKRSYEPILRYLYTEVKKRRNEILWQKHFNDRTEWQLDKSVFKKLLAIFGKPEVDMFASRLNHQLPLYFFHLNSIYSFSQINKYILLYI